MIDNAPTDRALYAIELSDGCIKVGASYHSKLRVQQIARAAKRRGVRVLRSHFCARLTHAFPVERDAQARIRRRCAMVRGREWFYGVRFPEVVTLLKQLTRAATCAANDTTPHATKASA